MFGQWLPALVVSIDAAHALTFNQFGRFKLPHNSQMDTLLRCCKHSITDSIRSTGIARALARAKWMINSLARPVKQTSRALIGLCLFVCRHRSALHGGVKVVARGRKCSRAIQFGRLGAAPKTAHCGEAEPPRTNDRSANSASIDSDRRRKWPIFRSGGRNKSKAAQI